MIVHAMSKVQGGTVDLYGFGGAGHHNDPSQNIGHQVDQEWQLWTKLAKEAPWFRWHRNEHDECSDPVDRWSTEADKVSVAEYPVTRPRMREMLHNKGARVLVWTIGDSSWRNFVEYDEKDPERTCITLDRVCANGSPVMLCNLAVPSVALRQNRRLPEKKIEKHVQSCGMDANTPFMPVQVPCRGGLRSWAERRGDSREEAFVRTWGAVFTEPLVSILTREHWTDE